jgi:tetratricopeptide (TPR) repeat protein
MATTCESLAMAVRHHQMGQLQAAEQIYRRILAVEPDRAEAWHLLGMVLVQSGQHETGVECIRRALALRPDFFEAHYNLGNALKSQGELAKSAACYRRALELKPDCAEALNNLGIVLRHQGRLDEAVACYRRVLAIQPDGAATHYNLGVALQDRGMLDEAVACYRRAVELKPDYAKAVVCLASALQSQNKFDAAAEWYHRAVELNPGAAELHYNLGAACQHVGNLDEAVACYRRALELRPEDAETHNNLGAALQYQGKTSEAIACYHRALQLNPDFSAAHNNLGNALRDRGNLDEAVTCYRRALDCDADNPDAHTYLALAWLVAGDWQRGWSEYEWRWRTKQASPRRFAQPLWDGSPPAGKTILLHSEQGLGDTLQFVRYAAIVKRLGATVIVGCQKALTPLLAGCPGIDRLVAEGDVLPQFDLQAPLLSLPRILQTSLDSAPAAVPYLFAAPALIEAWKEKIRDVPGFKVGINWQGRPGPGPWVARNIPLRQFAPLAQVPGVRLISLQQGPGREELTCGPEHLPVLDPGDEVDRAAGAFMDTAAIMMNCDMVITSDTAVPHLAGALRVPVWLALPFAPDWRWMLARADSPWYPTMRLFRQTSPGDWQGVFCEIEKTLRARIQRV